MTEVCPYEHCVPQVPDEDEEFSCPKCGAGVESEKSFGIIIEPGINTPDTCELIHTTDDVICSVCDYYATGEMFTKDWLKKKNQEPCPHCEGKGYVDKEK